MSGDPKRLLGGHATDTLTEEERRELLRAALDDQELFDALVEEEGVRELLETPGARQEMLDALGKPTAWERFRSWFARPATFGDVAAVAATVLVVFAGYQLFRGEAPERERPAASQPAAAPVRAATLAHLMTLPPREVVPAGIEPEAAEDPAVVRSGEPLKLRVSLRAPARVVLIAETPDGAAVQVHPLPGAPPAFIQAPPAGGPGVRILTVRVPDQPGALRLRLVVTPEDVDLGAASPADVDRLAPRLTLIDQAFEVTAP